MPSKTLATLGCLIALAACASAAAAASQKLWDICAGENADAAIKACTTILAGQESSNDKAIAYNLRGYAYNNKSNYDRAIADTSRAIQLDPKLAAAYENRGFAYGRTGDYDHAIEDSSHAIELAPNLTAAYENRRHAYDRKIAEFSRAIERDPKDAMAFEARGFSHFEKGELSLALDDLNRAIALDASLGDAYKDRGNVYLKLDKVDLARADLKKALKLMPNSLAGMEVEDTLAELDKPKVAAAEPPTSASPREENFENKWVKLCREICSVTYDEPAAEGRTFIEVWAEVKNKGKPLLNLQLTSRQHGPSPSAIQIKVDDSQPIAFKPPSCDFSKTYCLVSTELTDQLFQSLLNGKQMMVSFVDPEGHPTSAPVPLASFSDAYNGQPLDEAALQEADRQHDETLHRVLEAVDTPAPGTSTSSSSGAPPGANTKSVGPPSKDDLNDLDTLE